MFKDWKKKKQKQKHQHKASNLFDFFIKTFANAISKSITYTRHSAVLQKRLFYECSRNDPRRALETTPSEIWGFYMEINVQKSVGISRILINLSSIKVLL